MTLTKKKMVREIGRRTRLTNREVQEVVETLVDVWTEALINEGKIEIQNFLVLDTIIVNRNNISGFLDGQQSPPISFKKVVVRSSKKLRAELKQK